MYGKGLLMITEWSDGTFTAEKYPFGGEIIMKDKSLDKLLVRLAKPTNMKKIPRLKD